MLSAWRTSISEEPERADRRVGIFISKAARWQDELAALRSILLDTPLSESLKWRQPVYTFDGANVAILWAFKDNCGLGFFKGALMQDPDGVLVAPGQNSRAVRKIPFTSAAGIAASEPTIRAYVDEAIGIQKQGLKVDLPKDDLSEPEELVQALAADPILNAAFLALTPGRRRSWILHVGQAKKSATRYARLEKARHKILDGKGLNDR